MDVTRVISITDVNSYDHSRFSWEVLTFNFFFSKQNYEGVSKTSRPKALSQKAEQILVEIGGHNLASIRYPDDTDNRENTLK